MPGMIKPDLQSLSKAEDRLSFVYLEYCQINKENSAITMKDKFGTTFIPASSISVLLLGPGTSITHRAIELIGDAGVIIIWVGEYGVKYYASGASLTNSSNLLVRQAELVSNQRKHLMVVRKMYEMRFSEDVSSLTLQQLRGREGTRIKHIYKEAAKKWGIEWNGRNYNPYNFSESDPVNQALSVGNQCLYGICHAVIQALGCSAGLGFVHVGHANSFVYDIADLYKATITIPIAFEIASECPDNLPSTVRHRIRDEIVKQHLLSKIVKDINSLLMEIEKIDVMDADLALWNNRKETVSYGVNYEDAQNS